MSRRWSICMQVLTSDDTLGCKPADQICCAEPLGNPVFFHTCWHIGDSCGHTYPINWAAFGLSTTECCQPAACDMVSHSLANMMGFSMFSAVVDVCCVMNNIDQVAAALAEVFCRDARDISNCFYLFVSSIQYFHKYCPRVYSLLEHPSISCGTDSVILSFSILISLPDFTFGVTMSGLAAESVVMPSATMVHSVLRMSWIVSDSFMLARPFHISASLSVTSMSWKTTLSPTCVCVHSSYAWCHVCEISCY